MLPRVVAASRLLGHPVRRRPHHPVRFLIAYPSCRPFSQREPLLRTGNSYPRSSRATSLVESSIPSSFSWLSHYDVNASSVFSTLLCQRTFSSSSLSSSKNIIQNNNINNVEQYRQKQELLEQAVTITVRNYLSKHYEGAFSNTTSWVNLLPAPVEMTIPWKNTKQKTNKNKHHHHLASTKQKKNDNHLLELLTTLNGMKRVVTPSSSTSLLSSNFIVPLAEGVIAKPNDSYYNLYKNKRYDIAEDDDTGFLLFSQTKDKNDNDSNSNNYVMEQLWMSPSSSLTSTEKTTTTTTTKTTSLLERESLRKKHLPDLIPEDIKFYRILENHVEEYIRSKFKSWFVSKTVLPRPVKALQSLLSKSSITTEDTINTGNEKTTMNHQSVNNDDNNDDNNNLKNSKQPVDSSPNDDKGKTEECDDKQQPMEKKELLENILVVSRDEILLLTDMTPSTRTLALNNHVYGHKTASTFISVSLVVFGALPVAYRSLQFALEYPGWSQLMAASVLGTVSYGIWSSRSMAVTRQSQHVNRAVSSRIYARNDAVLWTLQQSAIRRLTKALLALYYHYQPHHQQQQSPLQEEINAKPKDKGIILQQGILSNTAMTTATTTTSYIEAVLPPVLPSMSMLDPIQIAMQFKLIVEEPIDEEGHQEKRFVSVSLDDALDHLDQLNQ